MRILGKDGGSSSTSTTSALKLARVEPGPSCFEKQAFTLLELLVVMLIIGLLLGLGVGGYQLARRSALEGRAKAEIELLRTALEEFRVEYGSYPQAGSIELYNLPEVVELTNLVNGISLLDPWERPYRYESTNRFCYALWSDGVDTNSAADNIDPSRLGY